MENVPSPKPLMEIDEDRALDCESSRHLLTLSHKHFLHGLNHKISLNTPDPLDARRNGMFGDRIVISEGRRRMRGGNAEEEGRKSRTYGGYRRGIV